MKNFILKFINNVEDISYNYSEKEIKDGKELGILCYICPIIPYFLNKKNSFVKYHSVIGMNLFVLAIFYYIFFKMITAINIELLFLKILLLVIWFIILLLACLGISNVCNGKAKELPIINKIKVFK